MVERIIVVGVPVDANPDEESIEVKRIAILKTLPSISNSLSKTSYSLLSKKFSSKGLIFYGCVDVPPYLLPLPPLETLPFLNSHSRIEFIKKDALREIAERVKEIVPSFKGGIPFLISEEHCITYGALKALKEIGKNPIFLCFDSHIDAISLSARLGKREKEVFSSTNFILKIIEDGILEPKNIFIIGTSEKFLKGSPPFEEVSKLKRNGLRIIGREKDWEEELLFALKGREEIYLSFDADVCAGEKTCGVRMRNLSGIRSNEFFRFIKKFKRKLKGKKLVGIDLCEIDPLVADSFGDRTITFWAGIINFLLDEGL